MRKLIMQPEFTNHCNFKCLMCPQSVYKKESEGGNLFNRKKGYMGMDLFDLFLENANKYARRVLIGFFGEPLLHPRFNEFIKAFPKERNYDIVLFTNWSLVTFKNLEALKLCDSVRISLDASYAELWNKLCPGRPVLDLIGNVCEDRYNAIITKLYYWLDLQDRPPTQIVYTVSAYNKHDKDNFIQKWQSEMKGKDQILTKAALSYGGVVLDETMFENPCNIISKERFTVAWNGDCTPCNLDVNIGLNVGNMLKIGDIRTIVRGDKYKQIMDTIKSRDSICTNCFDANNWTRHQIYDEYNL